MSEITMPSDALIIRAVRWLDYFNALVGQGIDFLAAEDMADAKFGFTRTRLQERMIRGDHR